MTTCGNIFESYFLIHFFNTLLHLCAQHFFKKSHQNIKKQIDNRSQKIVTTVVYHVSNISSFSESMVGKDGRKAIEEALKENSLQGPPFLYLSAATLTNQNNGLTFSNVILKFHQNIEFMWFIKFEHYKANSRHIYIFSLSKKYKYQMQYSLFNIL